MKTLERYPHIRPWLAASLLAMVVAGCGGGDGGRDPVLGFGGVSHLPPSQVTVPPSVTAVVPVHNTNGVARQNPIVAAVFSEAMVAFAAPGTQGASFTLTCAAPCAAPAVAISLDASRSVATLALASGVVLAPLTLYTATITSAQSLSTGLYIPQPFVWHFTTGETMAAAVAPQPPTVTSVSPWPNAASVPLNNTLISADFSEPMDAFNGNARFTLTCKAPCVSPTGTVRLDAAHRVATLTLPSGTVLNPATRYTATVANATSLATGLPMVSAYEWQFTTGLLIDATRPGVLLTVPVTSGVSPTPGVPANAAITAVFTEDMAPASINTATFNVRCDAPCITPTGSVGYTVGNRTGLWTPTTALAAGTTYTATITVGATDLAGNTLAGNQAALPGASNYVWTFTTAAATAVAAPITVASIHPVAGATDVCTTASVNATWSVPSGLRIDPATVNSAVFTVTSPTLVPVTAASVVLDSASGRIASFTPLAPLTAGTIYTARIQGGNTGVKDLAVPANHMVNSFSWTFQAVSCATPLPTLATIPLGTAASFGVFGGSAGTTNQGVLSTVNGDVGTTAVSTAVTGLHDAGAGCTYTETPLNQGTVNGKIYTAAPPPTVACPSEGTATTFTAASQARADALMAYNALVALPGGPNPGAGNLANQVLAPGVYTAASGAFRIQGGNLTLDAQGDTQAVWVFQMPTTLTVGGPGAAFPASVILSNGAQAKNVFWQIGTFATINAGGGGAMAGTLIAQAGAAFSTAGNTTIVTLNGRALSLGGSVTLVNTFINVPAP